jgi:hypothetical protein
LIKSSTIEILKKLVVRITMLGARERTVKSKRSWRENATSCPLWGFRTERSIKGTTGDGGGVGIFMVPWVERLGKAGLSWADAGEGAAKNINARKAAAIAALAALGAKHTG